MSDISEKRLEPRVARLEGEVRLLVSTVKDFISASDAWRVDITKSIQKLAENLSERTRPNFSTMAAWAAIILTVIGGVASPCGFFVLREMGRQDKMLDALDAKLQREQTLVAEQVTEKVTSLDRISKERHEQAVLLINRNFSKIERLEDSSNERIKGDLEELRQWRMKAIIGTTK